MPDVNIEGLMWLVNGENLRKSGSFEKAIECYDEVIRLNPSLAIAYNNRGSAKNNLGRHEEAIKDFDESIRLENNNATAYNNRGSAKNRLGRYEEAIKDFDEAIRLDPNFALAFNNSGFSKNNLGRYEEAIKDCDEAIRLNPNFAMAYNNRGFAKESLGCYEEAVKDFDEAIRLNPNIAMAYNNRGLAKIYLGRYEEAIKDYDVVTRLEPDNAPAYNNRGFAKGNLGRYEEAIKDFDEAIRLNQNFDMAYSNRGFAKNRVGRYEEAIKDLDKSIRLKSDEANSYCHRGFAEYELGLYEKAINDFDEAINLNSSYARSFFGRAMVFEKFFQTSGNENDREKNRELAERDFKAFLKLADDSLVEFRKYADTALERLEGPQIFYARVSDSVQLKDKAEEEALSAATENAQLEAAKATQTAFDLLRTYPEMESKTEAVMFVDICGSTGFLTEWGIKEYLKRVFILEEVVIACNPLFKKGMGDGFMLVYKERKDAVMAAFEIMRLLKEKNSEIDDTKKIAVRIGISSGQTEIRKDGDRYGPAVILAARLESFKEDAKRKNFRPERGEKLPEKDRILVSYNIIRDPAFPKDTCSCIYLGDAELNGFEETRQKIHLLKPN